MKLSDFDYHLPKNLIAQEPAKPRDHSRLLIMDRKTGVPGHKHFYDLPDYLLPGDVLVLNNSRVFPARLIGRKKETGGKIEVFLLRKTKGRVWQCLLGGRGRKEGLEIAFGRGFKCRVAKDRGDGTWEVEFSKSGREFTRLVEKIGLTPLPPYIKRDGRPFDKLRAGSTADGRSYQTVYADERKTGSAAAPTAGLHFTPRLLARIKKMGVRTEFVTLHVGLGTFAPVKTDNISKHKMHAEWVEAGADTIARIYAAKKRGRRIIAVGTTSVRTLEAIFTEFPRRTGKGFNEFVDIFIYPGYKFKVVDAMITNFHLPKSTLLMLVSAFAGRNKVMRAYRSAIRRKYRFYSYGDAMFIG